MKKFIGFITAIAVMIGLMLGFAPTASAEETPPPPPSCQIVNPDTAPEGGTCADIIKASESHSEDIDQSYAAVGTNGKILTRYAVAAGMKLKASEKTGCTTVSKASQIPRGENCIWGKRGFHFTNSGYKTDGSFVKWADYVGSPGSSTPTATKMKFVKRNGQWYKVGTPTGAGNCGNKVWFGTPPKLTWRQVINIKSFANWIFKGNVAVKASALTEALSKSWCSQDGTLASALARAFGSSSASASASYQVRGLTQIKQWTNAKAAELTQSLKLTVHAEAEAFAKAKASSDASTKVVCSSPPPPPNFESPQVNVVAKACINEGQSQDVTFTVHNPNDTVATVRPTFNGMVLADRPIGANATITITVPNQPVGPFSGSVLLVEFGKSASFSGEVKQCASNAPTMSASAGPCVNQGGTDGVITVSGTNHDTVTRTLVFALTGKTSIEKTVVAGSTETVQFTGIAPGSYIAKVTVKETGLSVSQSVTQTECVAVDHAPQISCVFPAHVYVGGNVYLWCEASDSDGDALSVNIVGDQYAHVSGVIPSDVRWDGTACPVGKTCYRATLWGDAVGTSHVVATVTANGKSGTPSIGDVPVKPDEF